MDMSNKIQCFTFKISLKAIDKEHKSILEIEDILENIVHELPYLIKCHGIFHIKKQNVIIFRFMLQVNYDYEDFSCIINDLYSSLNDTDLVGMDFDITYKD